jgi:hypothetical protein
MKGEIRLAAVGPGTIVREGHQLIPACASLPMWHIIWSVSGVDYLAVIYRISPRCVFLSCLADRKGEGCSSVGRLSVEMSADKGLDNRTTKILLDPGVKGPQSYTACRKRSQVRADVRDMSDRQEYRRALSTSRQ